MEFSEDSCIRGHNFFQGFCTPSIWYSVNVLQKKEGNPHYPYAIAVIDVENRMYWGMFPRQISAGC